MGSALHPAHAIEPTTQLRQRIYAKYAIGEISLEQVSEEAQAIKPTKFPVSLPRRIGKALAFVVAAILAPQTLRKD